MRRTHEMMLCFAVLIFFAGSGEAMKGRDFVVSFFEKHIQNSLYYPHKFFIILSEVNTTVHIESVGFGISDDVDVVGMEQHKYETDKDNYYRGNLDVTDMTFHVTSLVDITLFCYNYEANDGDGYAALPAPVLSTSYMLVTNKKISPNPSELSRLPYNEEVKLAFLIMATEDNTQVNITLRIRGTFMAGGCGNWTFFDGETNTYTLNKYQVVGAYCDDDITGTMVYSDKPVAVLSGHNYDRTVASSRANHLVEMLLPLESLGRSFVLLEPPNQLLGGLYRIVGSQASTNVYSTSGLTFTVGKGEPYDLDVDSSTGPVYIEADKPVTVVQFSKTKSAMALVPPTSLYSSTYDFGKVYAQPGALDSRQFRDLYLTVTVPTDMVLGIKPDIFPQFTVIEGSCFSFATTILDIGFHRVFHDQGVQFGTMLHVLSALGSCFSHPGGFNLTSVVDKTTCPPSDICLDGTPYPCSCTSGYFEYQCTDTSSGCSNFPCHYNSTCDPDTNSYSCDCINGTGGAHCEFDTYDDCQGNWCNNGTCIDEIHAFTCNCTPGFEGVFCGVDIDECASNPCVNGTCNDLINMYNCTCIPGYEGLNCDTEIDECASSPCGNGGVCSDLLDAFQCACQDGFNGTLCENDIDECISSPCQNGATCNDFPNLYNCSCAPGYEGTHCQTDTDECLSDPCQNGGTCNEYPNFYNCSCVPGYAGVNCETDIDECATNPCVNGTCNNYINMYNCTCDSGYEGTNCDTDIDECFSVPCQNGGACNDYPNFYNCSCVPGYAGVNCETDINECESNPCVNGTCNNYINMYNCTCISGYEGTNCDTEMNECDSSPCQNGGVCTDLFDAFECTCAAGFNGSNCENEIDECSGNPCQNGGNCTDFIDGYNCTCPDAVNGTNCEQVFCAAHPCENSVTCTDSETGFKCTCMPGFEGDKCEIDINECASDPCINDGTCLDEVNAFQCLCPDNFTGLLCELFLSCGCHCLINGNITDEELAKKISWWKSILLLDKSTLSKQIRKKISIPDDRPTSTGIGASGIACLTLAFGFFFIMDGLNVVKLIVSPKKSVIEINKQDQSGNLGGPEKEA